MAGYWDSVTNWPATYVLGGLCVALLALIWLRLGILHWIADNSDIRHGFHQLARSHIELMDELNAIRRQVDELCAIVEFRLPQELDPGRLRELVKEGAENTEKAINDLRSAVVRAINDNTGSTSMSLERLGADLAPPNQPCRPGDDV